jgi:membrane protein implicated in regulation of membrane protease activity
MKAWKMDQTVQRPVGRRINWISVMTVLSAATLIGAEVFGAAYAGGWAVASLLGLGEFGYVLQILFFIIGLVVMAGFIRNAQRVEPFVGKS